MLGIASAGDRLEMGGSNAPVCALPRGSYSNNCAQSDRRRSSPIAPRARPGSSYPAPRCPRGGSGRGNNEAGMNAHMVWRPIDTAPKDGTDVLAFQRWDDRADRILVMQFNNGRWRTNIHSFVPFDPSHWMPLPAAPGAFQGW